MWILVFQRMAIEFLWDFVYFPIWWYTGGVKRALIFCFNLLKNGNYTLCPMLWLKNIFVPMYGEHDLGGKVISFFMRLVNVIGRSIALLVWLVIVIFIFCLWLVFPIVLVYMLGKTVI